MLIGPSVTLEKLEEHMRERLYEIKMDLPKKQKEFYQLGEDFKRIPRTVIKEKDGAEVEESNPDFIKIPGKMKEVEASIVDLQDQQQFIEDKLNELETIEDRSKGKGNIDKSEYKITLTLNDCLAMGIAFDEAAAE